MYPILFRVGGFTVTSYGVMLVLAFVAAGLVVSREFKRRGWDPGAGQDVVLAAMLGGLVGSKLYWAFSEWDLLRADPAAVLFSRGGFTYYGGLVGGIVCVVLLLRWRKYPLGDAVNSAAPAVPVAHVASPVSPAPLESRVTAPSMPVAKSAAPAMPVAKGTAPAMPAQKVSAPAMPNMEQPMAAPTTPPTAPAQAPRAPRSSQSAAGARRERDPSLRRP